MKRFALYFFLAVFRTAAVMAAGDVAISRAIPVKNDTENTVTERKENTNINRAARRVNVVNNAEDKTVTARNTARTNVKSNDAVSRTKSNVTSRSLNNTKSVSSRPTVEDGANTVGRNARVNAASINSSAAVRRAGLTLRASTAEVGGRAMIIGTNKQTGSNIDEQIRNVQSRAAFVLGGKQKQTLVTSESLANAKDILERTADLNNTCQQQYNECMDQFCAVVDANQKRCSCSANLSRYVKAQKAVEDANIELNDVAQRIRYVGLSADEIRAIMSATEAEDAMTRTKDTTENRSLLDKIANMIEDPTASTSATDTSGILDLDFDFSSDSNEIFGLNLSIGGSSNDISKKRGADLYREATKRCKSVLSNCKDAGGTESQITGNYDLAIDKDCIAYEQGLDKLNKTLVSNVRSANIMLQKARLAVLQNKNQYNASGCVGALEKCMLDDMVCGDGYLKCVDPTKKYIDENGTVVVGQQITSIFGHMINYNNTAIDSNFIRTAVSSGKVCQELDDGSCIVNYLMKKIGTGQSTKDGGLCRAVLDKCQYYTYTTNNASSVYNPYNDVVVNYIQRAMVNIKAAQSRIVSDYAANCLADMSECYNQQLTQINTMTTSANIENVRKVMTGACRNVALTCGYAVFAYNQDVASEAEECATCTSSCPSDCTSAGDDEEKKEINRRNVYINRISEVFYQSLLCPENSTYNPELHEANVNRTINGYVNAKCQCNAGYTVWDGACMLTCPDTEYRNNYGICSKCSSGYTASGGNSEVYEQHTENDDCEQQVAES